MARRRARAGSRRARRRVAEVRRRGAGRCPRGGPGHLQQDQQVGHPVLEGLEGADRAAELHPLLRVGDGHVQAASGAPTWSAVTSAVATSRSGCAASPIGSPCRSPAQPEGRVEGRPGRSRSDPQERSSPSAKHDVGGGTVEHEPAAVLDTSRELAGSDPGEQLVPRVRRSRGGAAPRWRSRRQQRVGRQRPAELLEHHGGLEEGAPTPSYSSGTTSAATPICSHSVCHRSSSYPLRSPSRRGRRRCRRACRAGSGRWRRAPAAPR